jgi:hypothetical protein
MRVAFLPRSWDYRKQQHSYCYSWSCSVKTRLTFIHFNFNQDGEKNYLKNVRLFLSVLVMSSCHVRSPRDHSFQTYFKRLSTLICAITLLHTRALHWVPMPMPMGFGWSWVRYYCSWVGMGGYCFQVSMDGHSFQLGTEPMPINIAWDLDLNLTCTSCQYIGFSNSCLLYVLSL